MVLVKVVFEFMSGQVLHLGLLHGLHPGGNCCFGVKSLLTSMSFRFLGLLYATMHFNSVSGFVCGSLSKIYLKLSIVFLIWGQFG